MIWYPQGAKRVVKRFVLRKKIGDEVRYFQFCTWEEEWQTRGVESYMSSSEEKFIPTMFLRSDCWSFESAMA